MIIKQELINRIKDYFSLNIYETKVWLALLGSGIASAGEIAELSGVPRSRTYDVLEGLEKEGFCIMKLGKPVKYIAIKPDIIVEKLKSNVLRNADEKIESIEKLKDREEFHELKKLHSDGIKPIKQEEISGSLKGRSTIYNHIKEILENAKGEAVICTSLQEFQSKLKFFSTILEILKRNDIKIKIALSGEEKEVNKISNKIKIKITPISFDTKFFIADSEQILFIISNNSSEEDIAIWLNTPFFASTLSYMFNQAVKSKV